MRLEFVIRLKKKKKKVKPAADSPLMNQSHWRSERRPQEVWLLNFSEELGGTGRNPESQTAVIKYISYGKVLFENRMDIVHILMTYITQCKYCLWEVCLSAEINMELALGCRLFINVGVRALIWPWWFLRAQGRHVMGRVRLIPSRQVCDLSCKLRSQDRLSSAGSLVVVWRSLFLCGKIWSFNYFKVSHPKLSLTSWNMFYIERWKFVPLLQQ